MFYSTAKITNFTKTVSITAAADEVIFTSNVTPAVQDNASFTLDVASAASGRALISLDTLTAFERN